MDFVMIDVTDVDGVRPGDEVVLLGQDGDARITAEQLAAWIGTINYEVTTRINERIVRVPV
jgi:alanine racemase